MQLYLMQHGQALAASENPERPLSREGVATIRATAAALKKLGLAFDTIACTRKKRSHQSAALVAEAVNYPYTDLVESDTLEPDAPPQGALAFLAALPENGAVLVAGHLPSLAGIAALLLGAPVRLRFEHGGVCRLDLAAPAPGAAELVWQLTAPQLRLLGNP
jgi:phosphohistidine phosphatase